jgi:hypothetical protein
MPSIPGYSKAATPGSADAGPGVGLYADTPSNNPGIHGIPGLSELDRALHFRSARAALMRPKPA